MALASAITRIGTAVEAATDKIFAPADRDAIFKGEPPPARMRGKIHMGNGIKLTVAWVLPSGRSVLRSHPPKSLTLADSPAEAVVVNPGSRAAGGCSSRAPGLRAMLHTALGLMYMACMRAAQRLGKRGAIRCIS